MPIVPAEPTDVQETASCLVSAFAADPLISYFFSTALDRRDEGAIEFFSLLLRARIELGMPIRIAKQDGRVLGAVMGYDTSRPAWPAALDRAWEAMEASVPGMAERFAIYQAIADAGAPSTPHYYLGVLGVHPSAWGKGLGRALIEAFCRISEADPRSTGVYLETGAPQNVPIYERCDFRETHRAPLGAGTLWCFLRSHPSATPPA